MLKLAGTNSEVRTSEQSRQGPEKEEENSGDHPGDEHDESDLAKRQQRVAMEEKWFLEYFLKLSAVGIMHVPQESSFPIPLEYVDVFRRTNTTLDVLQERNFDDCWNVDGDGHLPGPWTGVTHFTRQNHAPPQGYTWSRRRLNEITSNVQASIQGDRCLRPRRQQTTQPEAVVGRVISGFVYRRPYFLTTVFVRSNEMLVIFHIMGEAVNVPLEVFFQRRFLVF